MGKLPPSLQTTCPPKKTTIGLPGRLCEVVSGAEEAYDGLEYWVSRYLPRWWQLKYFSPLYAGQHLPKQGLNSNQKKEVPGILGGGNSKFFQFSPLLREMMNPFWRAYFSDGLVKNHQPVAKLTSLKQYTVDVFFLESLLYSSHSFCKLQLAFRRDGFDI